MASKKNSTSRIRCSFCRLERSKFGRLLAEGIKFHHTDSSRFFRSSDTPNLISHVERIIEGVQLYLPMRLQQQQEAADNIVRVAQDGDRRALAEYLKDEKKPITSDIRKQLIVFLSGEKRARAHRPKATATEHRGRIVAVHVAGMMYSGRNYMDAVEDARKTFKCSDVKVLSACDKYGKWVSDAFELFVLLLKVQPMVNEILRRGEPGHCERAQELLERWGVAIEEAGFGEILENKQHLISRN